MTKRNNFFHSETESFPVRVVTVTALPDAPEGQLGVRLTAAGLDLTPDVSDLWINGGVAMETG